MDMSLSKLRELMTGKPGVLQSMGSQRVRQDWVTELNWTTFLTEVQSTCSYLGIEQTFKPDWSTPCSHSPADVCISKGDLQTSAWGGLRKLFFCSTSGFQVLCLDNLTVKFTLYIAILLVLSTWSCLTLCDSVDYIPPGSPIHGLSQASILEWVATSFATSPASPALGVTPGQGYVLTLCPKGKYILSLK